METALLQTNVADDVTTRLLDRRPLFHNLNTPMAQIDAMADAEEHDFHILAAIPDHVVEKARVLNASLLMQDGGPASPGELALLRSLLDAILA
jgi:hypothetical protein